MNKPDETPRDASQSAAYATRLKIKGQRWWKRWLDVQRPYRWNLNRLNPGFALDVGCGLGRNLAHLNGHGVGIDPNPGCLLEARRRGFEVYAPAEFLKSSQALEERFDSLLFSHVLEHIGLKEGLELVRQYLRFLKRGGKVIFVTPQEAGYRSDSTHVEWIDFDKLVKIAQDLDLQVTRKFSFPFPRAAGHFFLYNEFVVTAQKRTP